MEEENLNIEPKTILDDNKKTSNKTTIKTRVELTSKIPSRIIESLQRYVEQHIPTGGFLYAVLSNNLHEAFSCADYENLSALEAIITYVYWELPSKCWGSKEKVDKWLNN